MMKLLNFSHPLTKGQKVQIEKKAGTFDLIYDEFLNIDNDLPLAPQIEKIISGIPLSERDWQTEVIMLIPPGLNFAATTLLAELHGRMGHFPSMVRIKPVKEEFLTRYEIAEFINLQAIRDEARKKRKEI